ncbi:MAG: hypothetical protein ACREGE_01730 [Candidatus Microsaccharimonas sp.]
MNDYAKSFGYYYVTLRQAAPGRFLQSNNERAFIISQLQDLLSPRLLLNSVPAHKQLASCIDLLAFSVRDTGVDLLLFSIDKSIAIECLQHLTRRLMQYQSEYGYSSFPGKHALAPLVHIQKLIGPHQALAKSVNIHLLHDNWEFDRYSSIGFYLHDRRGDWMRTWRLAALYEHSVEQYAALIAHATLPPAGSGSMRLQAAA